MGKGTVYITPSDVAARLTVEFPGVTCEIYGGVLNVDYGHTGLEPESILTRGVELTEKMRLFNAHTDLGHLRARTKDNWWERV